MTDTRPSFGTITRADGAKQEIFFQATDDPTVFEPVHLDGQPVRLHRGDSIHADVLGPGQAIVLPYEE